MNLNKNLNMLEKIFGLSSHGTTTKRELTAGLITFLTMSYILVVNPVVLGATGMDRAALFTGTALAAVVGTLLMAFLANIPVAQAPGMGLNSFFASTVVLTMGYSWQFALTAVFIEGIIFVLLTFFNVREIIVQKIPSTLKNAIPVGIGFFITFIGLQQAGVIVGNPHTMLALGDLSNRGVWVALFGLAVIGILLAKNVPGAILTGILLSTVFALLLGETHLPEGQIITAPPSIAPIFAQFEWTQVFSFDMLIVVFTFLMVNMFDTIGTLLGVASKAGLIAPDGSFPKIRKALFADALGTGIGAVLGSSTVTSYVESASGVAAGGRTGLTAVSTAIFFLVALFFSPLFLIVPAQATAPALIIVGLFMLSSVVKINFDDFTESIPAYLTIILMPLAYSIAQGIIFGILAFVLIKLPAGRAKDISLPVYIIAVLFIIKIVVDIKLNS
jgi:AGZA family xanthine/uracil permease-like MFS transporter